jgi:hypothetical protein
MYNYLIAGMNQSLKETNSNLKGTMIIDDTLEKIARRVVGNRVSEAWHSLAFPFVLTVRACICDLGMRIELVYVWIKQRQPVRFIIRPFFHPEQFPTAELQSYARKNGASFNTRRWITIPKHQIGQNGITAPPAD